MWWYRGIQKDTEGRGCRWISGDREVYMGVQRDTERYRGMRMQMDKWGTEVSAGTEGCMGQWAI